MRGEQVLLLVSSAAGYVKAAVTPPRGVGPEFVSFYKPSSGSFQCISNPSVQLKYDQVNDDFCDCPDGSDEPGTSACAHLSSLSPRDLSSNASGKPALPGFYCQNIGHKPSYIPFTYVNDGICDYTLCCDGSDENSQLENAKCQDKCKETGDESRKQEAARKQSHDKAVQKRKDLIFQASQKRQEVHKNIENLKTQISAAEIKVQQMTREKADVERRERKRAASGEATAEKLKTLIGEVKPKVEELTESLEKMRNLRERYIGRARELGKMLEALRTEYNPNFNDEGVKRVIRDFEDYKAQGKEEIDESSEEETKMYMLTIDDGIKWHEYEDEEQEQDQDSGVFAIYDIRSYLPHALQDWISDKVSEFSDMLAANGIVAKSHSSSVKESKAVQNASARLKAAKDGLSEMRDTIKESELDLKKDYGVGDIFRSLKGTCLELDSGEYTYEMCWLDKVMQKSKKGGGSQEMGSFSKYETIEVDEDLPADGRGLGKGKRLVHKFEDGTHCWNGPNRRTTVVLACHENAEIWKVTEEEKCVYRMLVGTPAVCDEPGQDKDSGHNIAGGDAPSVREIEDDEEVDHDEL